MVAVTQAADGATAAAGKAVEPTLVAGTDTPDGAGSTNWQGLPKER